MKGELGGKIMAEFKWLTGKPYKYLTDDVIKNKKPKETKGVS